MKRTLQLAFLLTLVNYAVYASATIAVWLFATRDDFILAAVPGSIAFLGILLQPWFLFFIQLPAVGPLLSTAISVMFYRWLDRKGYLDPIKLFLSRLKWQSMSMMFLSLIGLGFVVFHLRMIDFPALHHHTPISMRGYFDRHQITPDKSRLYNMGSFMDEEWLWSAQLPVEEMEMFAEAFQLVEVNNFDDVPIQFFDMPPYWWRPQLGSSVTIYSTPDFPLEQRGRDGLYLLILYDEKSEELYAWIKDNF